MSYEDDDKEPISRRVPIGVVIESLETARKRGVTHVTRNRVYNMTCLQDGGYVGYVDLLLGELVLFEDDSIDGPD